MKIGVHSGFFHADDAFGVAVLSFLFPEAEIVRTRDEAELASCDALVDVGGKYDPFSMKYDHHQKSFSDCRENGVPFAAAGLVWRHHGSDYLMTKFGEFMTQEQLAKIHSRVDVEFFCHIDAVDTGHSQPSPMEFGISGIVSAMNPTWMSDVPKDLRFADAVRFSGEVLSNLTDSMMAEELSVKEVLDSDSLFDGFVRIVRVAGVPFEKTVCERLPKVRFVIIPDESGNSWLLRAVPVEYGSFESRQPLPREWRGLRGSDLSVVSGVGDSVFCHAGGFVAGAKSLSGTIDLARAALAAL